MSAPDSSSDPSGAGGDSSPAAVDIRPMREDEIAQIVDELRPHLTGARVREVRQRGDHDLILTLRCPGQNVWLLLSAHPKHSRLYALSEKPIAAARPSHFQDACRHDLRGAGIIDIARAPSDRRVTVTFTRGGETPRLEAELYARFSNLILVAPDGTNRAVLHPVDGKRTLQPNAKYVPAAVPTGDRDREGDDRGVDRDGDDRSGDRFALPLSVAAADRYELAVARADLDGRRATLLRRLAQARKKLTGKITSLERQQAAANDADSIREAGELLKANLHAIRRGQERIELTDYFVDPPVPRVIELDPRKTPADNLAALFKKYRKYRSGRIQTARVLDAVRENGERLDALVARVSVAQTPDDLDLIESEAIRGRLIRPRQRPQPARADRRDPRAAPPVGHLTFQSADGLPILVGRNGRENESITFSIARGGDLWLHVRDYPGSHVVVRLDRGRECPHETRLDAAHLAVHFSKVRGATRIEVTHSLRKFVQKLKGGAPGKVTLSNPSVLSVRIESDRLQRLLGRLAP